MNSIFGNTMDMTQKSLDYLWLKQNVSLNNLANNDTPGFKAQYVTFEDRLKRNLRASGKENGSNSLAMKNSIARTGATVNNTQDAARLDGNNVQVEAEFTEMSRSYLQYQAQIQSITGDINRLRVAIRGN